MCDEHGEIMRRFLVPTAVLTFAVSVVFCSGCVDAGPDEATLAPTTVATAAPSSTSTTVPATTSSSTTTAATTTSTHAPAPTTTTTTTVPPLVLPDGVELLLAHDDGVDLLRGAETIPLLEGVAVATAFLDGTGGVVYQRLPLRPEWDLTGGWYKPIWPEGVEPTPIEWIPAPGEPSQVLIPGTRDGEIELVDVTVLDTERVVIYQELVGLPDPCDWYRANRRPTLDEDGCMWVAMHSLLGVLTARELDGDRVWPLGVVEGWDAGASVSVGGKHAAVTPPGLESPLEVEIVDTDRLTALDRFDWPTAACDGDCRTIKPEVRCGPDPNHGGIPRAEIRDMALTEDGSRLAVIESHPPCANDDGGEELVIIDLDSGDELHRIVSPDWEWPWIVDFDGDVILTQGHLVIAYQPDTIVLPPANHYSLWANSSET
jgi:hypothetical protein